jgi:calcineurin-like phosphoesterase family protein
MKTFYTSDLHLGHFNIITYCNRPFKTLTEMNETLIRNWNARVKDEDVVYHVGDFCFKNSPGGKPGEGVAVKAMDYVKQLKGRIIFIRGNHDHNNSMHTITERLVVGYAGHRVNLVHEPCFADPAYQINFVGHVHQQWKFKRIRMGLGFTDLINVGVDVNKFMPRTFEELYSEYKQWLKTGESNEEERDEER